MGQAARAPRLTAGSASGCLVVLLLAGALLALVALGLGAILSGGPGAPPPPPGCTAQLERGTPSFFMRERSVDGLTPRISAAPPGPAIRPPRASSTRAM